MTIKIVLSETGQPAGKVADAELHFGDDDGLAGLKLIGFGVWTRRGSAGGLNVTFPARTYSVNGERRSYALLRPETDTTEALSDAIRAAYTAHVAQFEAA